MTVAANGSGGQASWAWYLRRVQNMQVAEVPHRIRERVLRQLGRFGFVASRDQRLPGDLAGENLPEIPLSLHGLHEELSFSERFALLNDIDRICNHSLTLLSQEWPVGSSCDWSLDPESGEHWNWNRYTFDIPRRSGQGPGDVKFVWELSRLQHLQVLALGANLLDRTDARKYCLESLGEWLSDNPPYQGLGYASGIELASRVISILVIIRCLGTKSIDGPLATKIWIALISHGRWIARFPSLYSSANNHLVAESAALFILGSIIPKVPEADEWRNTGWDRLVVESRRQILPDGVGAEQSPTYLAYTMEWLLLARTVSVSLSGYDTTRLDRALACGAFFISSIADRKGNIPFVGDCDDGVVIRPGLGNKNYPASIVAAVAASLQDSDVLHPAFKSDLRARMMIADAMPASTFALESSVFRDGGYSVIRTSGNEKEIFLLFDHGPLGFADTAAHGHADALAVWLHIDGIPILVDFGTFRYFADAGWRDWARSTAAHNTIEIEAQSQSEATAAFTWGRRTCGRLLEHDLDGQRQYCRASQDGYLNSHGIIHERQVDVLGDSLVVIEDNLSGEGNHSIKLHFHLSSYVDIEATGGNQFAIRNGGDTIATLDLDCPGLEAALVRQDAEMQPGPGAVSTRYNDLQPSSSIVISGTAQLPYICRTTIKMAGSDSSSSK